MDLFLTGGWGAARKKELLGDAALDRGVIDLVEIGGLDRLLGRHVGRNGFLGGGVEPVDGEMNRKRRGAG